MGPSRMGGRVSRSSHGGREPERVHGLSEAEGALQLASSCVVALQDQGLKPSLPRLCDMWIVNRIAEGRAGAMGPSGRGSGG